ncbi:MAG: glycosyltransferase [Clostridia bacterium]|nr:glycosyltransferase [Clostridia bacterium]
MKISIIIPMYNEAAIAEDCVRTLASAMANTGFPCEILFSDDGSTDDCAAIVEKTARELALTGVDIRVVRADKNRGKGHAVRLGMQAAQGDLCLFTDCDLAYGTDIIPAMANRMSSSPADVLIGSRAIAEDGYAGYTLARKLASKAYVRLLALSAGFRYTDSQCGIKLFRREAAKTIFSLAETDGWAFDFELLLLADKLGCKIEEYPVKVLNHRESKIHLISDSLKMAGDVRKIKKRIEKSE